MAKNIKNIYILFKKAYATGSSREVKKMKKPFL